VTHNPAFVRRCQARSCRGALPFEPSQRACRLCGRPRPDACASILTRGGSLYDDARLRDALDAAFNSTNFVGRVSILLSRVSAGTWSIDDAELVTPSGYDAKTVPVTALVASALAQAGLGVAVTPADAVRGALSTSGWRDASGASHLTA